MDKMSLILTLLIACRFVFSTKQSTFSPKAFLEACHDGDPEAIALFINDTGVADQMLFECLKMQQDNKDAYVAVLSSERFLIAKARNYPVYHDASARKIDDELMLMEYLYSRDYKKLYKKISENPQVLNIPNRSQLGIFRASLHNHANRKLTIALSKFVDYCALHGLTDMIFLLHMRADITYESSIPADQAENAFYRACEENNLDKFLELIVSGLISDPSMNSNQCARLTTSPEIIRALLHYPEVNAELILNMAVVNGHPEIVETVLRHPGFYFTRQLLGRCKILAFTHKQEEIYEILEECMNQVFPSSSYSSSSYYSDDYEDDVEEEHKNEFVNSHEDVEDAKVALKELVSPADGLMDRFIVQPKLFNSGSFGKVYRALDTKTQREVAIKNIDLYRQHELSHLSREIEIMKDLSHPNVVEYIDSYLMGDQLWIVMGLMTGDAFYLKREALDERAIAAITRQLVSGLVYLHDLGIIHRDIRPENILFNDAGVFKLADFGLSIKLESGNPFASSYVGTTEFMAPEFVHSKFYSNKIDIWSLGVTVYEMATGKTLYSHDLFETFMRNVIGNRVEIPKNLGTDLRDFLKKCLAVKPNERPSAKELLEHPFLVNVEDVDLRPVLTDPLSAVSYEGLQPGELPRLTSDTTASDQYPFSSGSDNDRGRPSSGLTDYLELDHLHTETATVPEELDSTEEEMMRLEEYLMDPGSDDEFDIDDPKLQGLVDRINSHFPFGHPKPQDPQVVEERRGRSQSRRHSRPDSPKTFHDSQ